MVEAYIGLGGNLGDTETTFRAALDMLEDHTAIEVDAVSSFIHTAPVGGPPGQPDYLNAAACLKTILPAGSLLKEMLAIETRLGRKRSVPWGPRTIDLDLLLYGDDIVDENNCKVPHPRMNERIFVLQPLAEIAPDVIHPVMGVTISELLRRLQAKS